MGSTFRPYQPDQILMAHPDLREWVSKGHLAHHVSDLVDAAEETIPHWDEYIADDIFWVLLAVCWARLKAGVRLCSGYQL